MQATDNTIRRFALVVLHEGCFTDFLFKLTLVEGFEKITAGIKKETRLDDDNAGDRGFDYVHNCSLFIGQRFQTFQTRFVYLGAFPIKNPSPFVEIFNN